MKCVRMVDSLLLHGTPTALGFCDASAEISCCLFSRREVRRGALHQMMVATFQTTRLLQYHNQSANTYNTLTS